MGGNSSYPQLPLTPDQEHELSDAKPQRLVPRKRNDHPVDSLGNTSSIGVQ